MIILIAYTEKFHVGQQIALIECRATNERGQPEGEVKYFPVEGEGRGFSKANSHIFCAAYKKIYF